MSVTINIKNTSIEFPSSGESPNWAPAIIEFAQATEEAINTAVGPYDIPNKFFTLPTKPYSGDVEDLSFPNSVVRAAFIKYSVILITTGVGATTKTESGSMMMIYNGSTWELTRDYIGDAECTFGVTSAGQITVVTPSLSGTHSTDSKISFSAQTLVQ